MSALTAGLRQPDARSCGAASLVMARLLRDDVTPTPDEFAREVLARHRHLTALRADGRWQVPWPRSLGTPPWAARRALEALTGRAHAVHLVRSRRARAAAYDRLARAGGVLYVGSRTLPRHVLLVLPTTGAMRCYQPSRGTVVTLPREELVEGRLRDAGWPHPWWTISPVGPAGPDAPGAPPPRPR